MTEKIAEKMKPDWVAVDWGTTRFARLCDAKSARLSEAGLGASNYVWANAHRNLGRVKSKPINMKKIIELIAPWLAPTPAKNP